MIKESVDNASMLETAFITSNMSTHNVYAVDGSSKKMTYTKIGDAQANSKGDLKLFINPEYATGEILIYKKE